MPLKEASSKEAAHAFLHHWAAIWGLPSLVTSDNGGSFTSNLWKDMLEKLNIDVKYSALYRPQSIGMLERQHQGLKNSLKAALIDMGELHQEKWMDFLPFVLLGRRVAFQPDMGASASQMTFGKNVTIPGELLCEPDDIEGIQSFQNLLEKVRHKTNNEVTQPSRHSLPEKPLPEIPVEVTHVYTKQHHQTGLQPNFEGPFLVAERTSRSVWKIEVGSFKDGRKRYEYRHLNDLKLAHPKSLAAPVERPKIGRPSKTTSSHLDGQTHTDSNNDGRMPSNQPNRLNSSHQLVPKPTSGDQSEKSKQPHSTDAHVGNHSIDGHATSTSENPHRSEPASRPVRSTRNPNPQYVDALEWSPEPWSATKDEVADLNRQIQSSLTTNAR